MKWLGLRRVGSEDLVADGRWETTAERLARRASARGGWRARWLPILPHNAPGSFHGHVFTPITELNNDENDARPDQGHGH